MSGDGCFVMTNDGCYGNRTHVVAMVACHEQSWLLWLKMVSMVTVMSVSFVT